MTLILNDTSTVTSSSSSSTETEKIGKRVSRDLSVSQMHTDMYTVALYVRYSMRPSVL